MSEYDIFLSQRECRTPKVSTPVTSGLRMAEDGNIASKLFGKLEDIEREIREHRSRGASLVSSPKEFLVKFNEKKRELEETRKSLLTGVGGCEWSMIELYVMDYIKYCDVDSCIALLKSIRSIKNKAEWPGPHYFSSLVLRLAQDGGGLPQMQHLGSMAHVCSKAWTLQAVIESYEVFCKQKGVTTDEAYLYLVERHDIWLADLLSTRINRDCQLVTEVSNGRVLPMILADLATRNGIHMTRERVKEAIGANRWSDIALLLTLSSDEALAGYTKNKKE